MFLCCVLLFIRKPHSDPPLHKIVFVRSIQYLAAGQLLVGRYNSTVESQPEYSDFGYSFQETKRQCNVHQTWFVSKVGQTISTLTIIDNRSRPRAHAY